MAYRQAASAVTGSQIIGTRHKDMLDSFTGHQQVAVLCHCKEGPIPKTGEGN